MTYTPEERKIVDAAREIKRKVARERKAEGKLSGAHGEATLRKAVTEQWRHHLVWRQNGVCPGCDITAFTWEFDHVIPLELGGSHSLDNLQALCPPCHKLKTREDLGRIAKAKRQAKLLQPREPSKRPIRSRGFYE